MRMLVTGGAGMVGGHAAEHWARQGHHVTVLDNLGRSALFRSAKESVEYNWRYLGAQPNVQLVRGDIRNGEDIRRSLGDGVDLVLHAAAQPGVGFSIDSPAEDFAINALGTLNVLETVRRHAPRAVVLYCSTNKVYGTNVDRVPLREETTRYVFGDGTVGIPETLSVDGAGHTPYGVSKLTGEFYVQDYAYTYGLRTAAFRMSCIYGTRQFGFEDQGWLAHFAIATLLGRPITIYGDGKQVRDVLYVEDLIEAYDRFVESALPHGVFNVGGGPRYTTSLLELLDLLERLTGKRSPITHRPWRSSDQKVYISDVTHAQQTLHWQPHTPLAEGLQRLLAWIEANRGIF